MILGLQCDSNLEPSIWQFLLHGKYSHFCFFAFMLYLSPRLSEACTLNYRWPELTVSVCFMWVHSCTSPHINCRQNVPQPTDSSAFNTPWIWESNTILTQGISKTLVLLSKVFLSEIFQKEEISKMSWNRISEKRCYFCSHEFHILYHSEMTCTASAVLAEAVNQMLSIKYMLIEKPTSARRHSWFC